MSFTKAKNYVSTSARFPAGSVNILRIPRLVSNFWKQNTQVQAIKFLPPHPPPQRINASCLLHAPLITPSKNISKKHIAVDVGHLPKVYDGWETARFEDDRYPYTRFKGFDNLEEGEEYTNDPYRIAGRGRLLRESRKFDPVKAEQGVKREIGIYIGQAAEVLDNGDNMTITQSNTRLSCQTADWLDMPLRTDYITTSSPQSSSDSSCRNGYDGTSRPASPPGLRSWLEPRRVSTPSSPSPAQSGSPLFPRLGSVPISKGSGRSQENIPNFIDLGPRSRDDPFVISDSDGSDIA
ncbi:hypothetical protein FPRO05_08621 [Fusarium proliferatum]|uniref:Ribonuclease H1 N-terminal domain-containing protein n=1 Tax=Gibberella intermedia TaxID=948311 RepID=A0A365NHH3_GIBIN|nr:hypothetical protein FPRO05_08621 [Fusarium proliferatum]